MANEPEHLLHLSTPLEAEHFWVTEDRLLLARHLGKEEGLGRFELLLVSIADGTLTPLETFNRQCKESMNCLGVHVTLKGHLHDRGFRLPPGIALSPDGKWITWNDSVRIGAFKWIVASLDGEEKLIYPHEDDPESEASDLRGIPVWLRDGHQWAAIIHSYHANKYWYTYAKIRDVHDPERERIIRFLNLNDGLILGVSAANEVVIRHSRMSLESATAEFTAVSLESEETAYRRYPIKLPHDDHEVFQTALSPDGRLVAWILGYHRRRRESEIWVSGLDGDGFRRLAVIPTVTEVSNESPTGKVCHSPRYLRWTPGGGHVSYGYKRSLWRIPFDS